MKKIRKQIRGGTFETNSSSMHSLIIIDKKSKLSPSNLPVNSEGILEIATGEYGWGYDMLETQLEKIEYLFTLLCHYEGIENQEDLEENMTYIEWIDELEKYAGIKKVVVTNFDGYVDHQSCCSPDEFLSTYRTVDAFDENVWEDEKHVSERSKFLEVIFDDDIKIEIANDNI